MTWNYIIFLEINGHKHMFDLREAKCFSCINLMTHIYKSYDTHLWPTYFLTKYFSSRA
jgi:hypothetical protein